MLVSVCLKSVVCSSTKRKKLIWKNKTLSCACMCTVPRNLIIVNQTNWSLVFLLAVALVDVLPVFVSGESVHLDVTSFVSDLHHLLWSCNGTACFAL